MVNPNPDLLREVLKQVPFGPLSFEDIIFQRSQGFRDSTGFHVYTQLRSTQRLNAAESEDAARKYLATIEDYVHAGLFAAQPFGVSLFEVQGDVLHFYKEGPLDANTLRSLLQFVYIFTSALYRLLKKDLGDDWKGFASAVDHGRCILLRHGTSSAASTISLGPAANRPAKQLEQTSAGCVYLPPELARLLGKGQSPYVLRLNDKEWLGLNEPTVRRQFEELVERHLSDPARVGLPPRPVLLLESQQVHNPEGFTVDAPYRLVAFCIRADLDGFSKIIEDAFRGGERSIEALAKVFAKLLQFAENFARKHGLIQLPWTGDCATFLLSAKPGEPFEDVRSFRWVQMAVAWQEAFGEMLSELEDRDLAGKIRNAVAWAVGSVAGDKALCLIAPIQATDRSFLVGAGWPFPFSQEAQDRGKAHEIVTRQEDYTRLADSLKPLFLQIGLVSPYYKTKNVTTKKIADAQLKDSYTAPTIIIANRPIPAPRPHCE